MSGSYVLVNPYHPYAVHLAGLAYRRYGLRAVCLYTDERARFDRSAAAPLPREVIAGTVEADGRPLDAVVAEIQREFAPCAVMPYSEETLGQSVQLAERLGLSWCDPAVLARIRDKGALKDHIRRTAPHLRLNISRRVSSVDEVFDRPAPERFVLKPNHGHSNRGIGFFRASEGRGPVERYFRRSTTRDLLLEEYIGGTEYFVNGQMDAQGAARVLAVFEYNRVSANGREAIDYLTRRVASHEPVFDLVARYAAEVMRATGLRRSPFHVELKVDDRGPCLIEIGARLAGNGNAFVCNLLHGGAADLFELAAFHALHEASFGADTLDWSNYDRLGVLYVHGVATRPELIWRLEGVEAVEAMAEFDRWVIKPRVGDHVRPTVDLQSAPYALLLKSAGPERELLDAAERARSLLRWNRGFSPLAHVRAVLDDLRTRIERRLRWALRSLPEFRGSAPLPPGTALGTRARRPPRRGQTWPRSGAGTRQMPCGCAPER